MKNNFILFSVVAGLLLNCGIASARNQINVVGSSTVYPFATMVAENFGLETKFKTPKVEATGSGGGLKLFCEGIGYTTPDITNASRRIKQSEMDRCKKNGVNEIVEVKIGYDGVILANSTEAPRMTISLQQIYMALAKDIPNPDGSETFIPNPYKKWSDIDASLPKSAIEVYGPPPTSGTRDAFVELALEGGCKKNPWIKALKKADKNTYKARCHSVREDGRYIEMGENDNLIVRKLKANPNALGIIGFSFLDENSGSLQGSIVENITPEFENIASGKYKISRDLYFYVKKAHINIIPGIHEFATEFVSDNASGEEGYLLDIGMIPLQKSEKAMVVKVVAGLEILPDKI